MRFLNMSHVRTAYVVKRRRQPQQTSGILWQRMLAVLIALFCIFAVAALPVHADADDASSPSPSTSSSSSSSSSSSDTSTGATLSADITDPENLLGDNVTSVTDMITKTKNKYGVSVRLLYLDSFGTTVKPSTWASTLLQSTSPQPNTVLLAVASADGNLVVAVSNNSDEWLKDQKAVDQLSQAASEPLTKKGSPDWSGSAIAMMNEIAKLKETSTSKGATTVSTVVLVAGLVLLVALVVVIIVLARNARGAHSKGGKQDRSRKALRRSAKRTQHTGGASKHAHADHADKADGTFGQEQKSKHDDSSGSASDLADTGASASDERHTAAVDEYLKRFSQQVTEHSQETRRQKRNARKHE